ncbi:jg21678 [Pararge aegeria aegeria]|uniref:Jg21678 protein n=1 Tax=Pararge aegeria aegeria TaxID=348720 RepID=A0A8S4R8B7_9NEOP|nr:jg21678 [Pararge aegeria aegeria]
MGIAMLGVYLRDQIKEMRRSVEESRWKERMDIGVPRCWNGSPNLANAALVARSCWRQAAQDRGIWNSLQKTYAQQWTSIG